MLCGRAHSHIAAQVLWPTDLSVAASNCAALLNAGGDATDAKKGSDMQKGRIQGLPPASTHTMLQAYLIKARSYQISNRHRPLQGSRSSIGPIEIFRHTPTFRLTCDQQNMASRHQQIQTNMSRGWAGTVAGWQEGGGFGSW